MTSDNLKPQSPNATMKMSPAGRARLRATEKAIYRYYNDMGKNKGHCTWGVGILAHRGVCSEEELGRKVSIKMVELEFERKIAETEAIIHRNITVVLDQPQFDSLCSLTYNAGANGSRQTYRFVNRKDFCGAANNMSLMIKVTVVEKGKKKLVIAPGLIRRRAEESAPFRTEKSPNCISK